MLFDDETRNIREGVIRTPFWPVKNNKTGKTIDIGVGPKKSMVRRSLGGRTIAFVAFQSSIFDRLVSARSVIWMSFSFPCAIRQLIRLAKTRYLTRTSEEAQRLSLLARGLMRRPKKFPASLTACLGRMRLRTSVSAPIPPKSFCLRHIGYFLTALALSARAILTHADQRSGERFGIPSNCQVSLERGIHLRPGIRLGKASRTGQKSIRSGKRA